MIIVTVDEMRPFLLNSVAFTYMDSELHLSTFT